MTVEAIAIIETVAIRTVTWELIAVVAAETCVLCHFKIAFLYFLLLLADGAENCLVNRENSRNDQRCYQQHTESTDHHSEEPITRTGSPPTDRELQ